MFMLTAFLAFGPSAFGGPRLVLSKDRWNLGTVPAGTIITKRVDLSNTGDAPLSIKRVRSTCECMQASAGANRIAPGKKAPLEFSVNTKNLYGEKKYHLYIESDAIDRPLRVIRVALNVSPPEKPVLETYPKRLYFRLREKRHPAAVARLVLRNPGGADLVCAARCDDPNIRIVREKVRVLPGKKDVLEIEYGMKKPVRKEGAIVIESNAPDAGTVRVPFELRRPKASTSGSSRSRGSLKKTTN
jgi:hypothetical protein